MERGGEKISEDRGNENKAGRQSKEGDVKLYRKEIVRKERKDAENHEKKKKMSRKKLWGKNARQKVRFEESQKPKEGKQSINPDHTKEINTRRGTNGKAKQWRRGWHGKGGREKEKVLKSGKNKNREQRRGGKKGARKRYEGGNLSEGDEGIPDGKISGGKRIPSKFFQRLKVGPGKEVATVHATENGRKVKCCINFLLCLQKSFPGFDQVSGKDIHTQPQSDEEDGRECRQRRGLRRVQSCCEAEKSQTIKKQNSFAPCACLIQSTPTHLFLIHMVRSIVE